MNGTEGAAPLLTVAIGLAAFLYSAVGHGGASAYLAVLALAGTSAAVMRPTALLLNVLVAGIGVVQFTRAGHLRWALVWPFLVTAIPMAYVGGRLALPEAYYRPLIGLVLCLAAVRFVVTLRTEDVPRTTPPRLAALGVGGGLGLLAGLTGVGGGIFLSPLMLLLGWADLRTTAATSAVFIVTNSLAGLGGFLTAGGTMPDTAWPWLVAAGLGGLAGSTLGSAHFGRGALRVLLALVLAVAGIKLLLGD